MVSFEDSNPDGVVTFKEWTDYYAGVSAGIDSDAYFAAMINAAWGLKTPPPHPHHQRVISFKAVPESETLAKARCWIQLRGIKGVMELV